MPEQCITGRGGPLKWVQNSPAAKQVDDIALDKRSKRLVEIDRRVGKLQVLETFLSPTRNTWCEMSSLRHAIEQAGQSGIDLQHVKTNARHTLDELKHRRK